MAALDETPLDEACRLLKDNFKVLLDAVQPERMCDELYSADILTDEAYEFVCTRGNPFKDRKRKLVFTALKRIKGYHERLEVFLAILEKAELKQQVADLVQKLCVQIRGINTIYYIL